MVGVVVPVDTVGARDVPAAGVTMRAAGPVHPASAASTPTAAAYSVVCRRRRRPAVIVSP